jgi:dipeptidyl aminopeptidase/acylaminoacyl peptidase
LELQAEDYAEVRAKFKTNLLRKGAAPQSSAPVHVPSGATEVQFPSGELRLKAWVNATGGKERQRALLFLHGGWAFGDDDWEMAQPFRDAGYVVMMPILRGENGQPGNFTMFYEEVDDVLAAADYLAKQSYVDPSHIYLSGHSAGGTLTLLAAMSTDRFRAAASLSGCPDQIDFVRSGWQSAVPFDQKDNREFQVRSSVAYATSFKCPVRIYYGTKESSFKNMSERTALLAKGKGLNVEAAAIAGDHFSSVPEAMKRTIEFFKQN